jgi:hypothetical protein
MGDIYESNVRLLREDFVQKKEAVERSYNYLIHKNSGYGKDHQMMIRLYNVLLDTLEIWEKAE